VKTLLITDPEPGRAERVAAELGARSVESAEALVSAGAEALVIAAATPSHAPLIKLGAEAGLPIFCEKPIAIDLATTDTVLEQVSKAGVRLQIGFQRRFDPGYRAARQAIRSGQLGDLYLVRVADHDPEPPPEPYVAATGGIWLDFMVHDFDAIPWVTGQEVVEVFADGAAYSEVFARHHDIHHGVAVLRLSGGALGLVSVSRHDPLGYDIRMELLGSRQSLAVGLDERTPLRSVEPGVAAPSASPYSDFTDRFEAAYKAELAAFLAAARGGVQEGCTGDEARTGLRVALAAGRSVAEHRPVRVEEIG